MALFETTLALILSANSLQAGPPSGGGSPPPAAPPSFPSGGIPMNNTPPPMMDFYNHCEGEHCVLRRNTGWGIAGTAPKSYALSRELNGYLLTAKPAAGKDDFETAFRTEPVDHYKGKRIRFSATLRPNDIKGGAGLWVRADGADGKPILLKDTQKDLLIGSKDSATYDLVVDIPDTAVRIGYGIMMVGKGQLYFDNVNMEVIASDDDDKANKG